MNAVMTSTNSINANHWALEEEIALILKLAAAQTGLSIQQASSSVNTLTANFSEMVKSIHEIKLEAKNVKSSESTRILEHCEEFLTRVEGALVGFQFYDRMHQRLDHIARHLENALQLVNDKNAVSEKAAWQALKERIWKSYNIEEDRILFNAVMNGINVKEAVKEASRHAVASTDKKVELF